MNAERLLAHYERIADAPDAIARLRRFVLDLAVRGKLVPQDPNDEPASELLKRIETKKGRSARAPAPNDGQKFQTPVGWTWTTLGAVSNVVMGQSPPGDSYNIKGEGVPLINGPVEFTQGPFGKTVVNQYTTAPTKFCDEGDLLICVRGSTTGRTNIAGFRACIGRGVAAIQPCFEGTFVRLFIWNARDSIINMGRGIAFPSVSVKQIEGLAVPLPPLAEQHRIVVKVHELMALCDALESARAEREETRDRLTAASLGRLNAPDSETFRDDARFAFDALPALTARRDQIKQLRQTILNLAVRGKLVPQDFNDEPTWLLLKRIAADWAATKREQGEGLPNDDEGADHAVPAGWERALIEDCFNVSGGIQKTPARTPKRNAFPYLSVGNVYRGRLDLRNVKQFELAHGELERFRLRSGDILIVEGNGSANEIGRCAVWHGEIENCVHQNHLIRCRPKLADLTPYAALYLNSPDGIAEMKRLAITTAGLFSLSVGKIRKISFPLSPLAEQHRIVSKVDELMALCDRLEASLATADETRRRLLDALLAEALAPDKERELEAAE